MQLGIGHTCSFLDASASGLSPAPPTKTKMRPRDGFNPGGVNFCSSSPLQLNSDRGYAIKSIGSLKPGHCRISFRGRIVNLHERETGTSSGRVKTVLSLAIKDMDNIIEVFPPFCPLVHLVVLLLNTTCTIGTLYNINSPGHI